MILVTGHGTIPSAVEAMQQGAFNYLHKPLDLGQLAGGWPGQRVGAAAAARTSSCNADSTSEFGFEGVIGPARR